jgi:hypothetical protein
LETDVSSIKIYELFVTPQEERVTALEHHVIPWIDRLNPGEKLIVGLPKVLGKWDECDPLIMGPNMQPQFLAWLRENAKGIRGPIYNLPKLNTQFLCIVTDEEFDPRVDDVPDGASSELFGTLASVSAFLTAYEEAMA